MRIAAILAGLLAISQAHADASITGGLRHRRGFTGGRRRTRGEVVPWRCRGANLRHRRAGADALKGGNL